MWYLPNVPANHGMLQRLRPQPMNKVQLASPALLALAPASTNTPNSKSQSQEDTELRTQSPHSERADSTHSDCVANEARSDVSSSNTLSRGISTANMSTNSSSPSKPSVSSVAFAEQLVTTRDDVFELFDKDGPSSSLYIYTANRVSSV